MYLPWMRHKASASSLNFMPVIECRPAPGRVNDSVTACHLETLPDIGHSEKYEEQNRPRPEIGFVSEFHVIPRHACCSYLAGYMGGGESQTAHDAPLTQLRS